MGGTGRDDSGIHGIAKRHGPLYSNTMSDINLEPWIVAGSQTADGDNRVGAGIVGAVGLAAPAFKCQYCDKAYAIKIGVGVNVSKGHKPEANDQIVVERKLLCWPPEEKRLLALAEAKLVFGGVTSSGINRELFKMHKGRTIESIKGRRRAQEHRDQVAAFLAGLQGTLEVVPSTSRETTLPITREVDPGSEGNDDCAAVGDQADRLDRLSLAHCSSQKAVVQLTTVSGHGVEKLLTAARRLAEETINPCHAIAAWYIEYGKNARAKDRVSGG